RPAGDDRACRRMGGAGLARHDRSLRDRGRAAGQRRGARALPALITQISAADLASWCADSARAAPVVVDVREPWEFERCRIDGSLLVLHATIQHRCSATP